MTNPSKPSAHESSGTEPVYRIGAVSRLTGISPVTIRAWERRYGVVTPQRTDSGNRLYSREDIARLALIKRLVDAGNAVSTVANRDLNELRRQLEVYEAGTVSAAPDHSPPVRVALLGDALPARLTRHNAELGSLTMVAVESDAARFEQAVTTLRPDVIILECATVHERTAEHVEQLLERSGAGRAVVVYGFARRQNVARLDSTRILPLRAPVGAPELRHACVPRSASPPPPPAAEVSTGHAPPRRFTDRDLSRIAAAATSVHCECPHHLVDLVTSLASFEAYSAECRNRSPQDAELHAYLQSISARSRALIEEALVRVVETGGLEL